MDQPNLLRWLFVLIIVVLLSGCGGDVELVELVKHTYTFDTFPDGTPIEGNTMNVEGYVWQDLQGDEFTEWGFLVDSTPVTNCVAVRMNFCWTTNNYLALLDCSNNARRIEISFIEPVREVELSFSGASVYYVMDVYDENGDLLDSPTQLAGLITDGTLFNIGYRSDAANIGHISFGAYLERDVVVVAIRGISYSK